MQRCLDSLPAIELGSAFTDLPSRDRTLLLFDTDMDIDISTINRFNQSKIAGVRRCPVGEKWNTGRKKEGLMPHTKTTMELQVLHRRHEL